MTEDNVIIKYLKLINGDCLVASSKDNFNDYKSKKYVEIFDPIEIKAIKIHHGSQLLEHYTMQPWIKMAKTEKMVLPTNSILLAVDIHEDAEMQYKEYLKDASEIELVKEDELELESEDEFYGDTDQKPGKIIH